ncbi:MAG: LysR family transcriptional regulator [Acholeplasmatales bacterium]|nr:LysR family transcriptional regulator [Acholeplasmatales bacterium]
MVDQKLITFLTLLEEKNYTKTAQKLYITQPSVTYHIQSIEKDYGITLFENAKTFELTEEGKAMLEYAKNCLIADKELLNNFKKSKENQFLEIGFTNTLAGTKNLNSIFGFALENNLFFNCSSAHHNIIIDKIKTGELDFGIIDHNFYDEKLESITLSQNNIILVCDPNGKYKGVNRITRENLQNAILVMGNVESGLYDSTITAFKNKNIKLKNNTILKSDSANLIINLVKNYDGIGFVYESTVDDEIEKGSLKKLEILNFNPYQNVYLIYSKASNLFKKKQLFIERLKKNKEV